MSERLLFNDGWSFAFGCENLAEAENCGAFEKISIPHTWNNLDGQDGGGDYLRGTGWYKKTFNFKKSLSKQYWLEFLGVNSLCRVYVNGNFAGEHRGGYTLFRFNVTDFLIDGDNTVIVCADNSLRLDIIPLTADFTFFGGIYRDVYLVESNKMHFALADYGSDGIKLSYENSPKVRECAELEISAAVSGSNMCSVSVEAFVPSAFDGFCPEIKKTDFKMKDVSLSEKSLVASVTGNVVDGCFSAVLKINEPHLWNGRKDPFCYKIVCSLFENGVLMDRVEKLVGFRYFRIHSQKGFFLNGKSYPLRGVNRHQDRKDMGWAITEKEHNEDFALIYEIGANAIRLAHYPHHPHFYDLCDRYGLLVWAEIPFVDRVGGTGLSQLDNDDAYDEVMLKSFTDNTKLQMTELIKQQCHRPSIFCWSMSNEVMAVFDKSASAIMKELDSLVHSLDNSRYSAIATNHTGSYKWKADIRGCNIYPGWYMGKPSHFKYQTEYHMRGNRLRGVAVSEYGAGCNVYQHTDIPKQPVDTVCDFHPEEWACIVHEYALKYFTRKSSVKIWGTFVWNMFDFAIDSRNEGSMPGMNNKGLVTYDRKIKKDQFYLYKSYWSDEPVVYINSRRYEKRRHKIITVKVYSNQPAVSLYLNGNKIRTLREQDNEQKHIFVFEDVFLNDGENTVSAKTYNYEDSVKWTFG